MSSCDIPLTLILSSGAKVLSTEVGRLDSGCEIEIIDPLSLALMWRLIRRLHVGAGFPCRKIWLKKLRKYRALKNLRVLVFDGFFWERVMDDIHDMLPNAEIVFYYWNQVSREKLLPSIKKNCETVLTFDYADAERYQLKFFQTFCQYDIYKGKCSRQKYDLSFIGRDKGRYDKALEIYSFLKPLGFKLKFSVVSSYNWMRNPEVSIKKPIKLDEYIEIMNSSGAVLELNCYGQSGLTLRALSTLRAGKKLVTDNSNILELFEDRYSEQIFILESDLENSHELICFLNSEYIPIPADKFEPYLFRNWISRIFT